MICSTLCSFAAAAAPEAPPSFDRDVKPIFERRCASCHGEDKQRGGLNLSTIEELKKGGDDGDVVLPGKSDESLLIKLIERREKPFMPPEKEGPPLTAGEIKVIRAWIDAGAGNDASAPADVTPRQPAPPPSPVAAGPPASQPATQLPAQVSSLAFSPDGKVLAAGMLRVVELLNPSDGRVIRRLDGHMENVRTLAFNGDGTLLAAGGGQPSVKGEVKIWNVADGTLVSTIEGHTDCVYGAAFSPDGKRVATASYDRFAYIWDAANGKQLHEFKNHVDAVYAVRFTTDGRRLLTASADRSVKVWDAESGKHLYNLAESQGALYTLALSPDGKQVAAAGADQMIRIWNLGETGGKMVKSWFAHERPVLRVAFSPDSAKLYSTSEDRLLKVWDVDKQAELHVFEPQSDWDLALAVAPAGGLMSVGRYDGSLAIYDTGSFKPIVNRVPGAPQKKKNEPSKLAAVASQPEQAAADDEKFKKVGDFIPVSVTKGAVTIPPGLDSINIKGATLGSSVTVTINGQNLDGISEVIIGDPGIRTRILEVKELTKAQVRRIKFNTSAEVVDSTMPYELRLELVIGYEARPDLHEIRVRNARGISNGLNFFVEDLSEVPEREPNDDIAHAQPISRVAVALGAINQASDVDIYRFDAAPGQAYVFEIVASALGSGLSGRITILKADATVLARSDDFGTMGDARVAFQPTQAGTYYVSIEDRDLNAGGFYRLRVADRVAITDAFPLGVQAGGEAEVAVEGVGLGDVKEVKVTAPGTAAWGQETHIPVDPRNGGALTRLKLAIGDHPELLEAEPNNDPARPQAVTAPVTINGRVWQEGSVDDHDVYRFSARKGQPLIIDVNAQRLGSPLDSFIEVLDTSGRRVERATLRSVAKTILVLVDRDSRSRGLRLENWDDLEVRDFLMIGNELTRVSRLPGYADEDSAMYGSRGQRIGWLGTTPQHHAVNTPIYKVQVHPPGSTFAPNGMPIFRVYTENDDGGPPTYGKDSVLTFEPPADGEYLVRIRSATGDRDRHSAYRLSIRPPRPEFAVFIGPADVNVPAGASTLLTATVSRFDNFDGPIHVNMADLPEGFTASQTVVLPDEETAMIVLTAGPGAKSSDAEWKLRAVATADINGSTVTREHRLRRIVVADVKPDVELRLDPQVVQLDPGGSAEVTVHVTRNNGFDGRVQIEVRNLPFGTDVANTGLNGVLIPENESQRTFRIVSFPWVEPMDRLITVNGQPATTARQSYLNTALPITLRIGSPAEKPQIAGRVAQN